MKGLSGFRFVSCLGMLLTASSIGCSAEQDSGRSEQGIGSATANGSGGTGPSAIEPGANATGTGGLGGAANTPNAATGGTGGSDPTQPPVPPIIPGSSEYSQDDTDASGLSQDVVDRLKTGGPCDFRILYPYEGTVFPGGIPAPIVQWEGGAEAVYVRMEYENLSTVSYEYTQGPSDPGRLQIPRDVWANITARSQAGTHLKVTLAISRNGQVSSCETHWKIALGNLSGALYYNTYSAPELQARGPGFEKTGAVMQLRLGADAATPFIYNPSPGVPLPTGDGDNPCISCHSMSASGSTMVATWHDYLVKDFQVWSFDLLAVPNPIDAPDQHGPNLYGCNFGALTPDGDYILCMGNPEPGLPLGQDFPGHESNFHLVEGPSVPTLWDTRTGQDVAAQGLPPDRYLWMPQFSPDGSMVVFNNAKPGGYDGRTDRRTLAIMDFDQSTLTFSNLREIYVDNAPPPSLPYEGYHSVFGLYNTVFLDTCAEPCYPGWPFFTPDNKRVVFARGCSPDFAHAPPRLLPKKSLLYVVDLELAAATGYDPGRLAEYVTALDAANGRRPDGSIYLPRADAEYRWEYVPTVMPVAAGGYFWLFWTSRRTYGNIITDDPLAPADTGIGIDPDQKRIWVSAIDIPNPTEEFIGLLVDPSHPAFYLPGQGESGNIRAFAALEPCKPVSGPCRTGLDCCTGFCEIEPGASEGACVDEPERCAREGEACESNDDCCSPEEADGKSLYCIAGYCSQILLE